MLEIFESDVNNVPHVFNHWPEAISHEHLNLWIVYVCVVKKWVCHLVNPNEEEIALKASCLSPFKFQSHFMFSVCNILYICVLTVYFALMFGVHRLFL